MESSKTETDPVSMPTQCFGATQYNSIGVCFKQNSCHSCELSSFECLEIGLRTVSSKGRAPNDTV